MSDDQKNSHEQKAPVHDELSVAEAPLKWTLNLKDLPNQGITGEKRADEAELRALTKMLNDEHELDVKSLVCSYDVKPSTITADKDVGGCLIEGCLGHFELQAALRQTCIVSLERIDTQVVEKFVQTFSSKGGHRPSVMSAEEEFVDPLAAEPPMKMIKGKVELGPLIYQYLSMAIDANPRKQGAQFEGESALGDDEKLQQPSPFVVLKNFKHKK